MKLLALALFAMACRTEVTDRAQPLQPSGEPVAEAPAPKRDVDDRTGTASVEDELPPSLFEANAGPKMKKDDKTP